MFQKLFKKGNVKAFGGALDYIRNKNSLDFGSSFDSASKFDNGLINYKQPSSINISKLRSESRKALIDSPELIALSRTLKVLVIGDGLKVNSAPERSFLPELSHSNEKVIKEYRKTIDTLWEMCADSSSFDLLGERNLYCLMQDAFEKWMQDGEVVIIFSVETDLEKLKRTLTPIRVAFALPEDLQHVSKDTKSQLNPTSTCEDGIELDKNGAPIAYWVKL